MSTDLKDIANRLKAVIETAIDGIITIDDKGVVETINRAAANLFEYTPEEVIGQNVKILMPEPDHSNHDGYIRRYHNTREPRIIGIGREVKGKKKNGVVFPFRLAISEVVLNNRVIFTGIVHDLSEIKEAQENLLKTNELLEEKVSERTDELEKVVNKLLDTNKQLEESRSLLERSLEKAKELNALKSRFVSMASHEFRTPLSTIMSSVALIAKYKTEAQQDRREKHTNRIKSAVNNLTGILNDFLSLSKLEEGKVKINIANIKISDLCAEVIDELKGIIKSGQELIHEVSGSDIILHTDIRILKNILFNLLSNAIKYSPENSLIKCEVNSQDHFFVFKIIDQGMGIPQSEQKYLFERFFRASNVENIQGTGLGLNIVKRYLNLLNGEIEVHSKEGEGSTFIIKIPNNFTL